MIASTSSQIRQRRNSRIGAVSLAVVAMSLLAGLTAVTHTAHGAPAAPYPQAWSLELEGWNRSSSPVIADIDADGLNEVVLGHQDGMLRAYEGDGTLKWEAAAVPGINAEASCRAQSSATAIDSSPAVADIDGDGEVEVIVGVGSTWVANQNGSVISFDGSTGDIEWAFDRSRDTASLWQGATPVADGWCEGTYATPAIGDVDGDGNVDVVFGSWDFYIWAVDGTGTPLPGFPINNDDTVWSSPALFDVDGDSDVEIFIGGDSTPGGHVDHLGGIFRAIDYRDGVPVALWNRYANEVFHSSPAIGDVNGDGRFEAVVGMGENWHVECTSRANPHCSVGDGGDRSRVWAFHLDDGSDVEGWPVRTGGTVWSSPVIGDVDADGEPEVVVGSFDHNVYAWNGDGSLQWQVKPVFGGFGTGRITSPAVIADLDGDDDQDVAVGSDWGLALLDGRDGSLLEAAFDRQDRVSYAYSHETAPAVGTIGGTRHLIVTGFDTPHNLTRIAAYRLPPTRTPDAWPMFRHGPTRVGTASTSRAGHAALEGGPLTYSDVGNAGVHTASIDALIREAIYPRTQCAPRQFCPRSPIQRWVMAVWLVRALDDGEPPAVRSHFEDVDYSEWWAPHVMRLSALGITQGCASTPSRRYCPDDFVDRAQMASFLVRALGLPPAAPAGFVDTSGNYHAENIDALAASRITVGCDTRVLRYCPSDRVSRAEMSTFIARALGLVGTPGADGPTGASALPATGPHALSTGTPPR